MATRDASPDITHLPDGSSFRFGIVVAQWNQDITSSLLAGAEKTLHAAGVNPEDIEILHVPGSFELPWGAKHLLTNHRLDGIICLGCLIKGETRHDEYIAQSVAQGLTHLNLASGIPVIFGVLTTNNEDQAKERAGGILGNKGSEAAHAVLQLATIKSGGNNSKRKIGY